MDVLQRRWPLLAGAVAVLLFASLESSWSRGGLVPSDRDGGVGRHAPASGSAAVRIPLADAVGSGAALAHMLELVPQSRVAGARLSMWRIAPPGSGASGNLILAGLPVSVQTALEAPRGGAAHVTVEDGAVPDRRAAASLVLRALKEGGDGSVVVIAPVAADLMRHVVRPARAEAYGLGDGIFTANFMELADSPYELVHALLDLIHCVDNFKHPWTAFREILEANKPLWEVSQELETIDVWPGGIIVSRRFGSPAQWPPAPFLPFEETARALPIVPDKVDSHTYAFTYEMQLGRVRAASQARGKTVRLLEIGLGCDMTYGEGAGFPLWRKYFGAKVHLTVLEYQVPCARRWGALPENKDTVVYVGDQNNRTLLRQIITERGPFDVMVDDGAHSMQGQTAAVEVFFPDGMAPGGVLAIEDLFTSHSKPPQ